VAEWSVEAVVHWRARWESSDWARQTERDDAEPWAMPLVVRVEKAAPPDHQHALYAATLGVVRLLAHPDSAPGRPWHAPLARWMDGRIRKVVRRARGARWREVEALPGVTVEVRGTQVRALLPHPVQQAPPEVARLQVSGLDLAADPERQVAQVPPVTSGPVLTILLAPGLRLSTGKACAQVGHAAQLALLQLDLDVVLAWAAADFPVRIVEATPRQWARVAEGDVAAVVVRDAGYTEVAPGTRTCAATFAGLA
jgi:hypothetical protein